MTLLEDGGSAQRADAALSPALARLGTFQQVAGVRVVVSVERESRRVVRIDVVDTGIGIPEDKVESIFELEKNISTKGTDGETGTGLGLVICKDFIEKNNGKIWYKSDEDKTTFYFTLPVKIF